MNKKAVINEAIISEESCNDLIVNPTIKKLIFEKCPKQLINFEHKFETVEFKTNMKSEILNLVFN